MEQYTEVTRIGINLMVNLGLEFIKIYLLIRILKKFPIKKARPKSHFIIQLLQ